MSNALLLDILAETSIEADYRAVYAELMASDRGRSFLTEFASRNLQPDTRKLVAMIGRLEAALHDNQQPGIPAALLRGLVDLAAATEEGEAALAATCTPPRDETPTLECVRDAALALRKRKVEPALCEALDAVAREVGDIITRGKAAIVTAQSALTLLQELSRRVEDIIVLAAAASKAELPHQQDITDKKAASGASATPIVAALSHIVRAAPSESPHDSPAVATTVSSPEPAQARAEQLGIDAQRSRSERVGVDDDANWFDDTPHESDIDDAPRQSSDESRIAAALAAIPLPDLLPDSEAVTPKEVSGTLRAPSFSRQHARTAQVPNSNSRVAPNDPLAAMLTLSQEELIALFT